MKILIKRKVNARSKKVYRVTFLLTPLVLTPFAYTQAATVSSVLVPGAGVLGNQLRQESVRIPAAPANAPLVLPEEGPARKSLSADKHTTVRVKSVVFSGNPPDLKALGETDLQQQLITDHKTLLVWRR
ncbi:hypothetical protein LRG41_003667 [Salmonella enterica]|nr:hypothetical protein [Salmonella enterica]